MAELKPFRALRPIPMFASQISSKPYDVVTEGEAKELIQRNEISFLRVTRSDVVCESSTPYSAEVYSEASSFLSRLKNENCFVKENEEKLYLYELSIDDHTQTGIAGTFSVSEYENNLILKHENTRLEKETDRTKHIESTKAQTGPAYLMFKENAVITSNIDTIKKDFKPLYSFLDDENVSHKVWEIPADFNELFIDEFAKIKKLYIADGHHRSASALNVKKSGIYNNFQSIDYFLGVAFSHNELVIGSCNRLILNLNIDKNEFVTKLSENFYMSYLEFPDKKGIKIYFDSNWYLLQPKKYPGNSAVHHTDSYLVQKFIFDDILNIKDPRSSEQIDYVRDAKGVEFLQKKVDLNFAAAAITIEPVDAEKIMEIAESGDVMPPKSTWFFPKLRDGLLIHEID